MDERETGYKQYERERMISLSDLFEEILRRIWLIIVLAVVFAVICAGYKYMRDRSKATASANTNSYERALSSLSDKEILEIESVLNVYDEVADADRYMTDSIRMNIDAYHEDRVTMQFELEAEPDDVSGLVLALDTYISEGEVGTDLHEFYTDVDAVYLAELVSVVNGMDADALPEAQEDETEPVSVVFTVMAIDTDAEAAAQLADNVALCLDSYAETLSGQYGSFELTLTNESAAQVYDSTLKSAQTTAVNDQITLQNRINTQTGYLSSDQLTVLNAMIAQGSSKVITETDSTAPVQTTAARVHISARYTLLGILIGIIVGIILIVLFYIARRTLNVAQELPDEFGIALLGQLHMKKQRNPLVRAWRRLVNKRKPLSHEQECRIAVTNLKSFCKRNSVDRILLTGSRQDISENEGLAEIRTALSEDGIEAEIAGGLTVSPETLEQMNGYGWIVLVETLHRSAYSDVVREAELCEEKGVQVAGAVVLE